MGSTDPITSETLPFSTLIHMLTIKLTSSNFLLWKTQITSVFECQDLLGFIDGTQEPPSPTVTDTNGVQKSNPDYATWRIRDRRISSLLLSSLTEETLAIVVGCDTSRAIWVALEQAFSHDSKAREFSLKDELHSMKLGSRTVSEFGRSFKALCDRLAAIGRPIDEADKSHWFLRGLGSRFANFSASQMAIVPLPSFTELLPRAESFETFLKSIEVPSSPSAAFVAHANQRSSSNQKKSSSGRSPNPNLNLNQSRGGNSRSQHGGRGNGGYRRPPRCQICRLEGHYADRCSQRYVRTSSDSANIAEAFSAGCSLDPSSVSDWYVDTGASAHMTPHVSTLDSATTYTGSDSVVIEPRNQGNFGSRKM